MILLIARLIFSLLLGLSSVATAQEEMSTDLGPVSEPAAQFVDWDSQHNIGIGSGSQTAALNFTAYRRAIPYLEITVDPSKVNIGRHYVDWFQGGDKGPHWFLIDQAAYLPEDIRNFLVTEEEGGIKKVKWLLSPQDDDFKYRLMTYFADLGLEYRYYRTEEDEDKTDPLSEVRGFNTASRSVIVAIPSSNSEVERIFSFKTATSKHAQGDDDIERPYPVNWAYFNRRLSDYYNSQKHHLKVADIAWEAFSMGVSPGEKNGDIAISVRLMEEVSAGKKFHMSGFVLHDDLEMNRIARLNNMTSKELKKKISFYFAQALVEMNLVLGFKMSSAHLQNMRIEFDENMQLTGKIVFLDLTDGAPVRAVMERNGQQDLLEFWHQFVGEVELTEDYYPNRIINNFDWKQNRFNNDHINWYVPMDAEAMVAGARLRARELGYTKNNVKIAPDTKEIRFRFRNREQLNGNFRPQNTCSLGFSQLTGL